jgi:hypothetical protein
MASAIEFWIATTTKVVRLRTVRNKPNSLVTTKEIKLDYKCHIKCFLETGKVLGDLTVGLQRENEFSSNLL